MKKIPDEEREYCLEGLARKPKKRGGWIARDGRAGRCLECNFGYLPRLPENRAEHKRWHAHREKRLVLVGIRPSTLAEIETTARDLDLPLTRVVNVILEEAISQFPHGTAWAAVRRLNYER